MRNRFAQVVTRLAAQDPSLVLLSGDIGNRLFDPYKEQHSDRFFNCGVAEANMTGMAAGLALSGFRPVTYTITPFVTTRCLEQIRVDLCYQNLPALVVGVGAGLSYAGLGATHHACEDIAFLRAIPNMTVFAPGDAHELERCLELALQLPGPAYMRLGKKGEPLVHDAIPGFEVGQAVQVKQGSDASLLSTGTTLPLALEAAHQLEAEGVSTGVISFPTIKPLDSDTLKQVFASVATVATIEEHSRIGGFGSAVAEWMVDTDTRGRLLRFGTPDRFIDYSGNQTSAREIAGLTVAEIVKGVRSGTMVSA